MFRRDFLSKIGQLISIPFLCSFFTEKQNDDVTSNDVTSIESIREHKLVSLKSRYNYYKQIKTTQYHQLLLQLHDKQCISTKTLLEEIGLDYNEEVKRLLVARQAIA